LAVVPDTREPRAATDLVLRIARVVLDEPADLMAEMRAVGSAVEHQPLSTR